MVIQVAVPRVSWQKLEAKKLFYIDKGCWDFLFGDGKGHMQLNASQIWEVVKEARREIKGKKGVDDLGQNVVSEIRDYHPVTFDKAKTFLRLASYHFKQEWLPEEHIHKCIFWMPELQDVLSARSITVKELAGQVRVSAIAVQSLVEYYRGSLEVCRVVAEAVFDGDPDDHILTTLPDKPRSPEPKQGKMDIKKNPRYVYSPSDLAVRPGKTTAWLEV